MKSVIRAESGTLFGSSGPGAPPPSVEFSLLVSGCSTATLAAVWVPEMGSSCTSRATPAAFPKLDKASSPAPTGFGPGGDAGGSVPMGGGGSLKSRGTPIVAGASSDCGAGPPLAAGVGASGEAIAFRGASSKSAQKPELGFWLRGAVRAADVWFENFRDGIMRPPPEGSATIPPNGNQCVCGILNDAADGWPDRILAARQFLGAGGLLARLGHPGKLHLAFGGQHAVHADCQPIAQCELSLAPFSDNRAHIFAISVAVSRQGLDGDEALDEQIEQLHKQAVLGDADDNRRKFVAEVLFHEPRLLPVHQFALGVRRAPLGKGALFGDGVEIALCNLGNFGCILRRDLAASRAPGFRHGSFRLRRRSLEVSQQAFQKPVYNQIGIASDRRSEMSIRSRSKRKMTQILLAIPRLFERSQHQITEDALLGFSCDASNQLLVMPGGDGDIPFRHNSAAAAFRMIAMPGCETQVAGGQRANAEGITERGRHLLEFHHPARVRLLMHPVE